MQDRVYIFILYLVLLGGDKIKKILKCRKKEKGEVQFYVLIVCFLMLIFMVLSYVAERVLIDDKINTLKNKADAANLSVYKVIDRNELASTGNIVFSETDLNSALNTYVLYLKDNLNLNDDLCPTDKKSFIDGNVQITDLRLYSVKGNLTTEYDFNAENNTWTKVKSNVPDVLITPNNRRVTKTSVYTEIKVKIHMLLKMDNADRTLKIPSYTDAVN